MALNASLRQVRFDDMAICVNDRMDDPSKAGVDRYVGLEHLDSESLRIRRWGAPSDVEATKLLFRKGDIIFGRRRAYQRKLAVAHFDGICSAHAMVLRARPDVVLPEFLPFFMQSDLFMERALAISVGSLSPTINWKNLAQEKFFVPSFEEQRRLLKLLTALEALSAAAQDAMTMARQLFDSHAVSVFDDKTQTHAMPLGNLLEESQYGLSLAPEASGRFPILRMMNLVDGDVVENDIRYVNLPKSEFKKYRLEHGDVLFNRTNSIDLVGRTGLYALAGEHVFASYLVRLRVKRDLLVPEYLTAFLNAPPGRAQVLQFATKGVSQANVNASNLKKVRIPLLSVSQQHAVAREISEIRSGLRVLGRRLDAVSHMKRLVLGSLTRAGS